MTPPQKWHILDFEEPAISDIQQKHKVSQYFSKILVEKQAVSEKEIENILSPTIQSLHPPELLPDIEEGSNRIKQAIQRGERILIWGDEDTDGTTATVFLFELLQNLNARVSYHIPSRHEEGIGLNARGIQHAAKMGCSLIITVDCASSDTEIISQAKSAGVDVVVTDHHETEKDEKSNFPLINPKRKDIEYPFRDIAGVTVAFKLGWHVAQTVLSIRTNEWESIASEWYPLVFLGTYGDKVPLRNENWTLARLGHLALKKTTRKGLAMLRDMLCKGRNCDEAMLQKMISVFSTGKTSGWGQNTSFRILTEANTQFLRETISELIQKSEEWHSQATNNYKKLLTEVEHSPDKDIIAIYNPGIPYEFLGFCASRLKERFDKPVIAMSEKGNRIVGEARAPKGVDIHQVLAQQSNLLDSFGGHKPACGFLLSKSHLNEFMVFLAQDFPGISSQKDQEHEIRIIDVLPLESLSAGLKRELLSLAPFGVDNAPPLFLAKNVSLSKGVYSYTASETGEIKRIEMRSNSQTWAGINGKPIRLDIIYYFNSAGILTIADARPSAFNEPDIDQ